MPKANKNYHLIIAYWDWHAPFIHREIDDPCIYVNNRFIKINNKIVYKYNKLFFNIIPKVLIRLKLVFIYQYIYNFHGLLLFKFLKKNFLNTSINPCHFWIGFNKGYIQKIRDYFNCILVAERSGTHPDFQNKLIRDEIAKINLPFLPSQDYISNNRIMSMNNDLELSDLILLPSSSVAETFPSEFLQKIKIIPLGSNFDYNVSNNRDSNKIIIVAGASLRKGIHYLDDLVQGKQVTIVMTKSPFRKWLKSYLHKNHISWVDTMDRNELMGQYRNHGFLLLPSIEDGFGMVALEALSLGLTVYVSKFCGVSDLFKDYQLHSLTFDEFKELNLQHFGRDDEESILKIQKMLNENTWRLYVKKYNQMLKFAHD